MTDTTPTNRPGGTSRALRQWLLIGLALLLMAAGLSIIIRACKQEKGAAGDEVDRALQVKHPKDEPDEAVLDEIIDSQDSALDDTEEEGFDEPEVPEDFDTDAADDEASGAGDDLSDDDQDDHVLNPGTPSAEGQYMVIAGSFASLDNARRRLEKVVLAGFTDAEIVQFDNSPYHAVCALRTSSRDKAQKAVSRLRAKGIKSLVHRRR